MRDFHEALEWYKTHNTAREIGFNPDGMCQKVCRTARAIGPGASSAKVSQDSTPLKYRVHRVADLRRGMVLYFDDPNDSNKYGHIVTMIGRVPGFNPNDLNDVLVETNSVVKGKLVVVRASYFQKHWGDPFQFGAFWLNGQVLDYSGSKTRVELFRKSRPEYDVDILRRAIKKGGRSDLRPHVRRIDDAIEDLPDDKRRVRLTRFKEDYSKRGILNMGLLNEIVQESDKDGSVKPIQRRLRRILKSLPER